MGRPNLNPEIKNPKYCSDEPNEIPKSVRQIVLNRNNNTCTSSIMTLKF